MSAPEPTPIEQAVERVGEQAPQLPTVTLLLAPGALALGGEDQPGEMRLTQPEGLEMPRLFALDIIRGAWVPVLLAPGPWQLRRPLDDSLPPLSAPKLWVPS